MTVQCVVPHPTVSWVGLQCVIVVIPDHTHLHFSVYNQACRLSHDIHVISTLPNFAYSTDLAQCDFGLLSGPPGFTCWMCLTPVFSFMYCLVLIFALSPFHILTYMF